MKNHFYVELFLDNCFEETISNIENNQKHFEFNQLVILFKGYVSGLSDGDIHHSGTIKDIDERFADVFGKAYEKWGDKFSQNVYGEYSVVIIDKKQKIAIAAQDGLGLMPLYFSNSTKKLSVSSSLEILTLKLKACNLDNDYISEYLQYGDHYGEKTPYANIKRLVPGTIAIYSKHGINIIKRWGLKERKILKFTDQREILEQFNVLLTAAVKGAIHFKGTTWCELSGGLDSSTVVSAAVPIFNPYLVDTFSFIYTKSTKSDESIWLDEVVSKYNIQSHRIDADKCMPLSILPEIFYANPYHGITHFSLYKEYNEVLRKNEVDVVLTGMGGDAVLYGDRPEPFFLADYLLQGRLKKLLKELHYITEAANDSRPIRYYLNRFMVLPITRHFRQQVIQDFKPKVSWFSNDIDSKINRTIRERKTWINESNGVGDKWYLERIFRSARVISDSGHKFSMRADFRHPLMNIPLIEFMRSLPNNLHFSTSKDRMIQRAALEGRLPDRIISRNTKGNPDHSFYKSLSNLSAEEEEKINGNHLASMGYLDLLKWKEAIKNAKIGRCDSIKSFKATIALELWLNQLSKVHHVLF